MREKDAFYLLFVRDFGNGPLFKNQIELVNELLNTTGSAFYIAKDDSEKHAREQSRLKAYLSQLFSGETRRLITPEFRHSLDLVIRKKVTGGNINSEELVSDIVLDLREKNVGMKMRHPHLIQGMNRTVEFYDQITRSKYLSIFTSREISLQLISAEKNFSFVDYLVNDLFQSLLTHKNPKYYRFNFPVEQTCILFWRGVRKHLMNYIIENKNTIAPLLVSLQKSIFDTPENITRNELFPNTQTWEQKITSSLLKYLSINKIVSVFHLTSPVYLVPFIAIDPDGPTDASTYMIRKMRSGYDETEKLSSQEFLYWKFFVWDSVKSSRAGKLLQYSDSF